ncbi:tyrosine-type recombinase/integrase [Cellulomonas sp. 73-145]|uniref:tyrosine-type recombinase/integrase n=1 Tax=Cellulomonas sp. 73-145 TaxID=1895739 RepID=UPI001ACC4ED7|nr:tyrosine-type recombinase/integrase [Cellulomonas sp. 73-145]MBN9327640.1 tyrosine-type recombinase/integrase [Cellulomonas sp.]
MPSTTAGDVWSSALSEYVAAERAAGRSAGTIRLHRHYLRHLAAQVRAPYSVTLAQLDRYLAHGGWSPETRKSARGSLASFYRWAARMGYVDEQLADRLPHVHVPEGRPRPAPETVLAAALRVADHRTRLMLLLAAHAGLRCSEVSRVHSDDLVGRTLYVTGKGGKTRTVPVLRPELVAAIATADGWLFPGRTSGHLAASTVTALLSDALPGGWTGHTLRHRFATRAYAGTSDLLAVGELLGHSRPETTKRYVLVPDEHLAAAVAAAA